MSARILHLSDLHVGTHEDNAVERALVTLVERVRPELLVASGDLTDRGRREQHERAHAFLTGLGVPVLAVPGNHDIRRGLAPFREFERVWQTTEPEHRAESFRVVGLNSVRPLRYQGGALSRGQLAAVAGRLGQAPWRVVVLHHHLLGAPWRAARKRPVSHRNAVLRSLIDSGADLILAGHIHQSAVSARREFAVVGDGERTAVVAIAPGFGQPRPHRLGEARGLHVHELGDDGLTIETYTWRG
ncbi:MAG TPA: metallophosphoesterase, partial [Gaiellaceae bacterium]|nr:metallophosphoesterase [Gaiellaceae bacterium]